jgi:VIT1/CCC1 family predicted Fe2+/Mn2+ transporter
VRLTRDRQVALDTLAREELGLDPSELGSPWKAALSSFVMFAAGAIVPVLPFLFGGGTAAVVVSAILSALALLLVGGALALFTGRNPAMSALRMLVIGVAASAVTFIVGRLIGVSVQG